MVPSVTEIRENFQNPNPFPPQRPVLYRIADTLEKVQLYFIYSIRNKTWINKNSETCNDYRNYCINEKIHTLFIKYSSISKHFRYPTETQSSVGRNKQFSVFLSLSLSKQ